MATVINQRELRNDSGEIMRRVERGETFIVTRSGVALAELRPLSPERSPFVSRDEALASALALPPMDAARFRADLDSVVDAALTLD